MKVDAAERERRTCKAEDHHNIDAADKHDSDDAPVPVHAAERHTDVAQPTTIDSTTI